MRTEILLATKNRGKIREAREFFSAAGFDVLSLSDIGFDVEIVEDGGTFEANAIKKAKTVHGIYGGIVVADDSGLVIDALGGGPGVDSAVFLGADTPYKIRNQRILEMMAGLPDREREARFVCVIALVLPDGGLATFRGVLEGLIAYAAAGENGFGYDPIFYLPKYGKTLAQLDVSEKNKISHRGKALKQAHENLGF